MTGIVEVAKGALVATRLGKLVVAKLNETGADARMREAWEVDQRSWRAQRDARVEVRLAVLEQQAQNAESFADAVAAMLEDEQFRRVQANVEYEAIREATEARRTMLAHAAAGLADPGLPINLKARIERTLRGLDPEDVQVLEILDAIPEPAKPTLSGEHYQDEEATKQWKRKFANVAEQRIKAAEGRPSLHILASAGCVFISVFGNTWGSAQESGVTVTDVGRWVLHVLRGYVLASKAGDDHA